MPLKGVTTSVADDNFIKIIQLSVPLLYHRFTQPEIACIIMQDKENYKDSNKVKDKERMTSYSAIGRKTPTVSLPFLHCSYAEIKLAHLLKREKKVRTEEIKEKR